MYVPFRQAQGFELCLCACAALLLMTTLIGCGSAESTKTPDWYQKSSEDASAVYGRASATSSQKQVAIDKAINAARTDIVTALEPTIEGALGGSAESPAAELKTLLSKKNLLTPLRSQLERRRSRCGNVMRCLGGGERSQESDLSRLLKGLDPEKQEVYQTEEGTWRAFVLMALPVDQIAQALEQTLSTP